MYQLQYDIVCHLHYVTVCHLQHVTIYQLQYVIVCHLQYVIVCHLQHVTMYQLQYVIVCHLQYVIVDQFQYIIVFCVLLTVYLSIILFNDQLDTQFFFVYVYSNSLHVSNIQVLIIRRFSCIDTISCICHSDRLVCSLDILSKPAYQTVTYIGWHIPDIILIQLNLLMMSTWMFETCRELE